MHNRPNVLYIHSHDTGRYVEPYGYHIATPNLQKLATQGILFRNAFSVAPTCSPSRASLLTGFYPHQNGMLGLAHRGFVLNDYSRHILHSLRSIGYRSTLIGFQHIAPKAEVIGYDQVLQFENHNHAEQVAPAAAAFIRQSPKEPFFLDVGFFETHRPFPQPGPNEDSRFVQPAGPLPDLPETRSDMAAFQASARILDWGFGLVLDALDRAGLAQSTIVIATTDHGIPFPRMKCNLYDGGIGVMLIMRGSHGFEGGKVCDQLVSQLDLYPTLCDLLEIECPQWLRGTSLLPLVHGASETDRELFSEVNYHIAYEPIRAIRTKRWKYIRRFTERSYPILIHCDDSLSKEVWLKYGWHDHRLQQEELYDLIFDPNEANNIAGIPIMEAVLREFRNKLDSWMRSTQDPLLLGKVQAPDGAIVGDPDDVCTRTLPIF